MTGALAHWAVRVLPLNLRETNSRAAGGFTLYQNRDRLCLEERPVAIFGLRQPMDRPL